EAIAAPDGSERTRPAARVQQLKPAAFVNSSQSPRGTLARGQSPDTPQPLPAGPSIEVGTQAKETGDKPDAPAAKPDQLAPPRLMPTPPATSNSSHIVADNCDCTDGSPDCCGAGACGDRCEGWRRPLCGLLSCLWQPGCCDNKPYDIWFSTEYLLWAIKGANTPALVTTSPAGTPRAEAGVLSNPATTVLFGGKIAQEDRSGLRFTLGFWFDDDQCIGLEGSYFFLGDRSVNFRDSSAGSPILARPFFNATTGMEDSELIAFPGVLAG